MAQAGSAQREPSMEEILASIRRIIEDGESGHKDAKSEADGSREVEAFRDELKPAATSQPEPVAEKKVPEAKNETGRAFEWLQPESREPDATAADKTGGEEPKAAALRPVDTSGASQSPVGEPVRQAAAPAPQPSGDNRPAILSEVSGRKVAAAFEELSEAFEASRRKSLGEAAEEMLRPMLQEWLDNNLPQLVERLVREEIERVARGA
ncbi:PopZ family protein [Chelativorans alearense]|uniref:PopZ family protein n=1 Tax=Chelativorans alearense TaxID=2681495 RepID=UPI0013D05C1A|nr:DUF2497 domain-containing protein [Chelativorans alearense]